MKKKPTVIEKEKPTQNKEKWEIEFDEKFGKGTEKVGELYSMNGWSNEEVKSFIQNQITKAVEEREGEIMTELEHVIVDGYQPLGILHTLKVRLSKPKK